VRLQSGIKAGVIVGTTALFFAITGMFNALAVSKIAGVSLSHILLVLMGLWCGLLTARSTADMEVAPPLWKSIIGSALAGSIAGLLVAALVLLATDIDVRFVLASVTPETVSILSFGQDLLKGVLLLVGGGAILATLMFLLYPFLVQGNLTIRGRLSKPDSSEPTLSSNRIVRTALPLALLGLLLLLAPLRLGGYYNHVLGSVGIYVIMGLGLNVVVGFAGLLDLGYVAFFAIGSYAYAFLNSPKYNIHIGFWLALPIVVAIAALGGILLGIPVLRMRGDYLAIVTLGFGEIIRLFLNNLVNLTGGPQGILGIHPPSLPGIDFGSPLQFYYLILIGCVVTAFVTNRLNDSRVGRAWVAIREDEDVARAMGIDTVKYKLMAFAIGASFAGIGGSLFASRQAAIFPADFTLMVSINVLCLIIIGGMGSIPGVIAGSVALIGLPELLREFSDYRLLIFGALRS